MLVSEVNGTNSTSPTNGTIATVQKWMWEHPGYVCCCMLTKKATFYACRKTLHVLKRLNNGGFDNDPERKACLETCFHYVCCRERDEAKRLRLIASMPDECKWIPPSLSNVPPIYEDQVIDPIDIVTLVDLEYGEIYRCLEDQNVVGNARFRCYSKEGWELQVKNGKFEEPVLKRRIDCEKVKFYVYRKRQGENSMTMMKNEREKYPIMNDESKVIRWDKKFN